MAIFTVFVLILVSLASSSFAQESELEDGDSGDNVERLFRKDNWNTFLTFVLSARKLPSKDHHSKSDAYVELYSKDSENETSQSHFGTTRHLMDSENPDWHKVFYFPWINGTGQKLRFVVRDHDFLQVDDDIGEVSLNMDDYVNIHHENVTLNLTKGGSLTVKKTVPIYFRLSAANIPNKDGKNGKSDPYVKVWWRSGLKGSNIFVKRTSVIKNHHNPNFLSDLVEFSNWQQGTDQFLHFQVWDKDHIVKDDLIGEVLLNVDEFVKNGLVKIIKLENSNGDATLSIVPA